MTFTDKIEKLLGSNHLKEVVDEFLKFLQEVPQSNRDARNDANQLRGQVIVLSGRFTDLNTKINTNTVDETVANHEKSALINSFVNILNQLPSSYPDLNSYLEEKNEEDEWQECQKKNTIEGYHFYFNKYPDGKYKDATIKLIAELEEVRAKQDSEIKRLALLEKERRESDKTSELQKGQVKPAQQGFYNNQAVAASPAQSKKKLFITIGAITAAILIIFLVYKILKDKDANTAATDKGTTLASDSILTDYGIIPDEAITNELTAAIESANDVRLNAIYNLNADSLGKSYSGDALKTISAKVDSLKNAELSDSSILEQRAFKNFRLSQDSLKAMVTVEETWSTFFVSSSTDECQGKIPSYKFSQTIFLEKNEDVWLINSVVPDDFVLPEKQACN